MKSLATHVNLTQKKKDGEEPRSLAMYKTIRILGKGAAGCVSLARHQGNGELYALKTIELKLMSPNERKLAENEVTLLKVLNGPTIIHYYEHFTQNDTIYIVMEFAEKGSLSEKISEYSMKGEPIPNEQVQNAYFVTIFNSLIDIGMDCSACNRNSSNAF